MVDDGQRDGDVPAGLAGAGTEGGRRPTGVSAPASAKIPAEGGPDGQVVHPDPQVTDQPIRRQFTKAYKLEIVKRAEACAGSGQIGALLRREGLYSSHLTSWRAQHKQGKLDTPTSGKPERAPSTQQDPRVAQLQRENARLQARLDQAELMLEIQKKASEILGITLKTLDNEESV